MKSDILRTYKLGLTKEEKETVENFCCFMVDVMEEIDDYEKLYDIIDSIGYRNQSLLDKMNFKIYDIEEEREEK